MTKVKIKQSAFQHLLNISIELSKENNADILMEKILMAAVEVSNADAGSIYMVSDKKELEFRTIYNKSMSLHLGGSSENDITFPGIPLFVDNKPNKSAIVAHAAISGDVINIDDVYDTLPFDFSAARNMDRRTGYRTKSMLTFPLQDHTKDIIGVIQLINAMDGEKVVSFSREIEEQILSFASLGAIALTNRALITNMEQLFESFAKTIAAAIDAKSPHTGGHCKRVPELTLMIADAVHEYEEGPLASYKLSAEDRHQLNIAGWLHDCGKIATPDHVIEKSRKLETIFDRIQFVTAKLEVASRDIEIEIQQKLINALKTNDISQIEEIEQQRSEALKLVEFDRTFLQEINIGGEFLTNEQEEYIRTIANRYQISLDNKKQSILTEDEISNLSIKRGTLNNEERSIIQRHMNVTLDILQALPFPKHLSQVAEFALGHHETMDGKGYPRGLTKEQMSVPARLMALADIFEALSAADRPYKSAKPVSECLKIMSNMAKNNHLDSDLFTIFVKSKVYEKYINTYADPNQLDEFDVDALLP